MEIQDGNRINANFNYFWDLKIDAEKPPEPGKPTFYSEIEYCNNFFNSCNYDVTGWFRKKVQQQ